MYGILLIDKPSGWTSFDVVNYVRKTIAVSESKKPKHVKVGHTGTLDPLATGLLVLLTGTYTKRAPELAKLDKTYEVTMRLGEVSTTGDREGVITKVLGKEPQVAEIKKVLKKFTGELMQTPPIYSAMKVNGQRAYTLARAGKDVKLEARKVTVYDIRQAAYRYPEVTFIAEVSSGTYIRSLVEDLGTELGTGAYMSDLRRTQVGRFDLTSALSIDDLSAESIYKNLITSTLL